MFTFRKTYEHTENRAIVQEGYSLIEVMMVVFLTALLMMAITQTFGSVFGTYKTVFGMQQDLENAQFAMNAIAKSLRTSTIMEVESGSSGQDEDGTTYAKTAKESTMSNVSVTKVLAYNYSQNNCVIYEINDGKLRMASGLPVFTGTPTSTLHPRETCNFAELNDLLSDMTTGQVDGIFVVTASRNEDAGGRRVGKLTLLFELGTDHPVTLQTTVSLHDYGYVELGSTP